MFGEMYFRIHDSEESNCVPVTLSEASEWNKKGWGIFCTVNRFEGRRKADRLVKIESWYVELDGGDKAEQLVRIQRSPVFPSAIVESLNGYHVYFRAKDANAKSYREIEERLVHFFGGDPRAKDVCRLLRVPGFHNMKNPESPFLVREIFKTPVTYRVKEMLYYFDAPPLEETIDFGELNISGDDLTSKLNSLNNMEALKRLSGSVYVGGEVYSFKPTAGGKHNILVNGKGTSCFIDKNGKIGAVPGGPTAWQWLRYFNHSDKEIYRILKEVVGL